MAETSLELAEEVRLTEDSIFLIFTQIHTQIISNSLPIH